MVEEGRKGKVEVWLLFLGRTTRGGLLLATVNVN